jgi:DNA repair protein RadC
MTLLNPTEGHRKRLREKFIESGLTGFHDYEIIELLLTLGSPRKDCKQPAKETIERFKTLRGVLEAKPEELQQIPGIGPHNAFGLKLVQEVAREFLKEKLVGGQVYSSSKEMFDYLYHSMRDLKKEVFKILCPSSHTDKNPSLSVWLDGHKALERPPARDCTPFRRARNSPIVLNGIRRSPTTTRSA